MARSNIRMNTAVPEKVVKKETQVPAGWPGENRYKDLSWTALRKLASDNGVVSWRRTRNAIEWDLEDKGVRP